MSSQLFYLPYFPVPSQRGLPAGAARAYFYLSGTTTLAPIYADVAQTVPLANPVIADGLGRLPDIYLDDAITYRVRVLDSKGAQIGADTDPYIPGTLNGLQGPPGAADNTYSNLSAFKASDINRKTASLVGVPEVSDGRFNWTPGDYTGQADDQNVVAANSAPLSTGAWVRQTAASVSVPPETPAMKRRPLVASVYEADLTPEMFSGTASGVSDWGQYFQDMLDYAQTENRAIKMLAGRYPIGRTLSIYKEVLWTGAGAGTLGDNIRRGSELVNIIPDPNAVLIDATIPSGQSAITLDIGGFSVTTPGGYSSGYTRAGTALRLNTAIGHVVANSKLHDLIINNHALGVDIGGVIYKALLDNIRVSGESVQGGVPLGPTIAGIRYGIVSYQDVTYNITSNCEVTNVRNGGYGFKGSSQSSTWINCTADGPFDLTSIAGTAINCTVEGWTQDAGASPVNYALGFNRFGMVAGVWMRAIPAGRVGIGVYAGGSGCTFMGIQSADGVSPPSGIYNDGLNTFLNVMLPDTTNKMPATGPGGLNGSLAINCDTVTDFGLSGLPTAIRTMDGKVGFNGVAPVARGAAIANPTDTASTQAAVVSLLGYLRSRGDISA